MSGSPLYRARQIGSRTTLVTATVALIAALSGAFQLAPAGKVAGATAMNRFEASTPCRLVDTRSGFGFQAPSIDRIRIQVTGRCNVPREAVAASFTVTVSQPTGAGYLTMWPATTSIPDVSTLNFEAGDDRANGAIVRLAGDGAVDITASAPTQILLDVTGWFVPVAASTSGRFVPVEPDRIFDSRAYGFSRPLNAGEIVTIALPGGTPKDATAVAVNLTSVAPSPPGYLTAFPAGTEPPEASAVNTNAANQTRAASTLVAVSPQGLSIFSKAGGHVIVDLTGWFTGPSAPETGAGLFVANDAPLRVRDTRSADPVWDGGAVRHRPAGWWCVGRRCQRHSRRFTGPGLPHCVRRTDGPTGDQHGQRRSKGRHRGQPRTAPHLDLRPHRRLGGRRRCPHRPHRLVRR